MHEGGEVAPQGAQAFPGGGEVKDYSQNNEQAIILKYFGSHVGTVLDLGANDGILLSNSRALIELGWRAVLVEPAAPAFRKLVINNANAEFSGRVQCVNAAITTQDGPVDFYDSGTHLHKGDTSLLSTTRPEEMARWKRSGEVFTKTTVRGITFATLLNETGLAKADFISIDCEGVDLAILQQIDLTALGTRMVCVEVNRNDPRPFDEHCAKHEMRLHYKNWENRIYTK